jgi:hypothetical protein
MPTYTRHKKSQSLYSSWRMPPAGSLVDTDHPWARHLKAGWITNQPPTGTTTTKIRNIVPGGFDGTPSNANTCWMPGGGRNGSAWVGSGTNGIDIGLTALPASLNLPGTMTILAAVYISVTMSGTGSVAIDRNAAATLSQWGIYAGPVSTLNQFYVLWGNAGVVTNQGSILPGVWTVIGWSRSGSTGNWTCKTYQDQKLLATTTGITTNPSAQQGAAWGKDGNATGANVLAWPGRLQWLYIWDIPLLDADVFGITQRPFEFVIPDVWRHRTLSIPLAAPGTPTNLAASRGGATSTTLTWTQGTGTVTDNKIQYSTDYTFATGVTPVDCGSAVTSYTVTGLTERTLYFFRVAAFNGSNGSAYSAGVPWVTDSTLTVDISQSSDDADETSAGTCTINNTSVNLGTFNVYAAARWQNVTIAATAALENVYVYWNLTATSTMTTNLTLDFQLSTVPGTFVASAHNISNRVLTGNAVNWATNGLTSGWQRSPDLKTPFQAVLNQGGWASGDNVAFVMASAGAGASGNCQVAFWDSAALQSPILAVFLAGNISVSDNVVVSESTSYIRSSLRALADNLGIQGTVLAPLDLPGWNLPNVLDKIGVSDLLMSGDRWSRVISDTIGVQGVILARLDLPGWNLVVTPDTIAVSDPGPTSSMTYRRVFSDNLGISDLIGSLAIYNEFFSDKIGVQTAASRAIAFGRQLHDNVTAQTTLSFLTIYNSLILADQVAVKTSQVLGRSFGLLIAELLSVATAPRVLTIYNELLADNVVAADSISGLILAHLLSQLADNIAVSDQQTTIFYFTWRRQLADNLGISDAASVFDSGGFNLSLADNVTVYNPWQFFVPARFTAFLADVIAVSDLIVSPIIVNKFRHVADNLGISDKVTVAPLWGRLLRDVIGTSDSVARSQIAYRLVADIVAIGTQTGGFGSVYYRELVDIVAVADYRILLRAALIILSDTVAVSTSAKPATISRRALGDTIAVSSQVTEQALVLRAIADQIGVTDKVARALSALRLIADTVGITDRTFPPIVTWGRELSSLIGVSDQALEALLATRRIADAIGISTLENHTGIYLRQLADAFVGVSDHAGAIAISDASGYVEGETEAFQGYVDGAEEVQGYVDGAEEVQ